MNIYAIKGHKVVCCTTSAGYEYEQKMAERLLVVGNQYTVESTQVSGWSTDVYLQEFPNVRFNSVFFDDVNEQHIGETQSHPDFKRYN